MIINIIIATSETIEAHLKELEDTNTDDSWKLFPEKTPSWAAKPLQPDEFEVSFLLSSFLLFLNIMFFIIFILLFFYYFIYLLFFYFLIMIV